MDTENAIERHHLSGYSVRKFGEQKTDETGLGFSAHELNTSVLLKRCSLCSALQKSVTADRMFLQIPQQHHTGLHKRRSVHVTVISKS